MQAAPPLSDQCIDQDPIVAKLEALVGERWRQYVSAVNTLNEFRESRGQCRVGGAFLARSNFACFSSTAPATPLDKEAELDDIDLTIHTEDRLYRELCGAI